MTPALVAALLLPACAEDEGERPRRAGDCTGTACDRIPIDRSSASTGDGGTLREGGAEGREAATGDGTLSGSVRVYSNETFDQSTPFQGEGSVGAEVSSMRPTGVVNNDSYMLSGVPTSGLLWVDLAPTSSSADLMATLHQVDVSQPTDLFFVQRFTLEDIIAQQLSTPVTIEQGAAHAVLTFVDASGRGLPGIQITALDFIVAYDTANGVYREDAGGTFERGRVVLLNAAAVALPGAATTVTYAGTRSGTFAVKFARDAVSFATIRP